MGDGGFRVSYITLEVFSVFSLFSFPLSFAWDGRPGFDFCGSGDGEDADEVL